MTRGTLLLVLSACLLVCAQGLVARAPANEPSAPAPVTRYRVPLGDAPVEGGREALGTLVVFSDFQCPFCARLVGTLDQLQKKYGDRIRIAFKHNPLPFHPNAMQAAQAAVAAQKQGRFWPMYRRLYQHQAQLARAQLDEHA